MAITILPPQVEDIRPHHSDSDDSMSDADSDVEMGGVSRPSKRAKLENNISTGIVTPGEVVTSETQWMRLVLFKWLSLLYFALVGVKCRANYLAEVTALI